METVKAWVGIIENLLGFSITGLAIIHFTIEDAKSIVLLVLSGVFICVKIYDAVQTAKIKRIRKESDALDVQIKRQNHEREQLYLEEKKRKTK